MPGRWRHRRDDDDDETARLVRDGDSYTIDDEIAGRISREEREPDPDPPAEEVRGEPFGWKKGAPFPRGYREDEDYGPNYRNRDDPGPLDGAWPDEEDRS
jgi:hypothetical protein